MSKIKIKNLIKSVASRIPGFVHDVPPDSLIDGKAVMAAAIEHFKPRSEEELFLLLENSGEIRGTSEYKELRELYRFPCWHRVSSISIDILHDAVHFPDCDENAAFVACSHPHAVNSDLSLSLPISDEQQDRFLSDRIVTSLASPAAKVFEGYGVMKVGDGSEHISPFHYTIHRDGDGYVEAAKVATGLTLLYTDEGLQRIYNRVLCNAKVNLAQVRLANPVLFEALPSSGKSSSHGSIYVIGDPTTRH
jgi:hypothetical protein